MVVAQRSQTPVEARDLLLRDPELAVAISAAGSRRLTADQIHFAATHPDPRVQEAAALNYHMTEADLTAIAAGPHDGPAMAALRNRAANAAVANAAAKVEGTGRRAVLAASPLAGLVSEHDFATDPEVAVRLAFATNPSDNGPTPEQMATMCLDEVADVARRAVRSPRLTNEVKRQLLAEHPELLSTPDERMLSGLARWPGIPEAKQVELAAHENSHVRRALFTNPNCCPAAVEVALHSSDPHDRSALATNVTALMPATRAALIDDESKYVRAALITAVKDSYPDIVAKGVEDAHWRGRAAAAASALLTQDQLAKLGDDPDPRVIHVAKSNVLHPDHEAYMASLEEDEEDEEEGY
jgi:hypothetical protein